MDQYQKFYKSVAWQQKRDEILRRDCYQCQMCVARLAEAVRTGMRLAPRERHIRRAVCVHHIKELKECWEKRLDDNNLTSLCADCHNLVHGRTGADKLNFRKKVERLTEEKW